MECEKEKKSGGGVKQRRKPTVAWRENDAESQKSNSRKSPLYRIGLCKPSEHPPSMANVPEIIEDKSVVVIGAGMLVVSRIFYVQCIYSAGVIGLSTAIKVQERGDCSITILAEKLPTDSKCIKYTSHWAVSFHILIESVLLRVA